MFVSFLNLNFDAWMWASVEVQFNCFQSYEELMVWDSRSLLLAIHWEGSWVTWYDFLASKAIINWCEYASDLNAYCLSEMFHYSPYSSGSFCPLQVIVQIESILKKWSEVVLTVFKKSINRNNLFLSVSLREARALTNNPATFCLWR